MNRYLRLSLTEHCNLRCRYCMPNGYKPDRHGDLLTLEERVSVCQLLVEHFGIQKIRLTGGEPLVYEGVIDITRRLAQISGLEDLAMTTNAIHLEDFAPQLRDAGLKRLNVSLDTLDRQRFAELCQADVLPKVLRGIEAAIELGFAPIKLNAVILRGLTDRTEVVRDLLNFAFERGLEIRFLELMPIAGIDVIGREAYLPASVIRELIETEMGPLRPQGRSSGGTSADYDLSYKGGTVRVGFITPVSEPFCFQCGRFRLTSKGRLVTCLRSQRSVELLDLIRSGNEPELATVIANHLGEPRHDGYFTGALPMTAIGG